MAKIINFDLIVFGDENAGRVKYTVNDSSQMGLAQDRRNPGENTNHFSYVERIILMDMKAQWL